MKTLQQAFRSLRMSPGFSVLAIVTVALGVAANTAIFSMVEGVLLRRLPYASGDRLIHVVQPSARRPDVRFSIPEIADIRAQAKNLDAVVEYHSMAFQLYGWGEPQRLQTGVVSDNFFQVLGVRPFRGRLFQPGEEAVGAAPVVLLSYNYWKNVLGGDEKAIGARFTMNDRVHTVVGVLPPLPTYPGNNDIWVPAGACPFRSAPATMASRNARLPTIIARVRDGSGFDAAMRELGLISNRLHAEYPAAYPQAAALHWDAKTVRDEMTSDSKKLLLILFATAFFLMIVAAANFAGLTVARQLRRTREIAVREALGAGRMTIFRQLAVESLLLSLTGGILGSLLAMSTMGILRSFATRLTPRAGEIGIDGAVLVFAVLTCVVVGLAAAAAPLVRLKGFTPLIDRLRQGAGAMGGRAEARLRRGFVLVQVAIAFVLLVGAGLVGRSLRHLQQVDAGFDGHDVMTARVTLNFSKYNSQASVQAFDEELLRRLASTPATAMSAISTNLPLSNSVSRTQAFIIDGIDAKGHDGTPPRADFTSVSARYFDVINVPIRRGRAFTDADRDTIAPPVIVSQRLVANNWGGRDPIGTRISTDSGKTWNTVVGVAGDVRQFGLDQDVSDQVYFPAGGAPPGDVQILVRFTGNDSAIPGVLRNIVHGIDPQQAIASIQTMDQIRGTRLSEPMLTTALLSIFGAVALLLAALGLAGVIGYSVTQRIPEIAIRMALGADPGRVMRLIGFDGLSIVAIGLVAGAAAALGLSRFIASLLFSTPPHDPLTYVGVTVILFGTSVIACMGPIRRAIAADPARALRGG